MNRCNRLLRFLLLAQVLSLEVTSAFDFVVLYFQCYILPGIMLLTGTRLSFFGRTWCCNKVSYSPDKSTDYLMFNADEHVEGWGANTVAVAGIKVPDHICEKVEL